MEGYKTVTVAGVTSIVNLLVAFGLELTADQVASILAVVNCVIVPIAMVVLRLMTTGPTPIREKLEGRL